MERCSRGSEAGRSPERAGTHGLARPLRALAALAVLAPCLLSSVTAAVQTPARLETFEAMPIGVFSRVESPALTIEGPERGLVIVDRGMRGEDGGKALRVIGGRGPVDLRVAFPEAATPGETFRFRARMLDGGGPLTLALTSEGTERTAEASYGDIVSRDALDALEFPLPAGARGVTLRVETERAVGLLLDDLERAAPAPMEVVAVTLSRRGLPVVAGRRAWLPLGSVEVRTRGAVDPLRLVALEVRLEGDLELDGGEAMADGEARPLERGADGWWRAPLGIEGAGAPIAIDLSGVVGRASEAVPGALERDPIGRLVARLVVEGTEAPLEATPSTWTRALCGATALPLASDLTVESLAAAPFGITLEKAGAVVAVAGLRDGDGRPFVRTLRWSPGGDHTVRDLRPEDEALGYARPALILDRRTGRGLIAAESVRWRPGPGAAGSLVALPTEDGGETFLAPEPLDIVDDDDAPLIGGHLRLCPGRGVIEGTTWALPILRSHGHPAVQSALLVSEDEGRTWVVSTGLHAGARRASAVALGENAILLESWSGGRTPRAEGSTLNGGVWWLDLSETRPLRPASPEGVAWVHVDRETGWGPGGRLLYACAPEDAPHGLVLRGSNDYGAIWHVHRRAMVDDREGAGAPGLALVDEDRIAVLFRSGEGELLLQVRDLTPHAGPLKTLEGLFGPR